MVLKVGVGKKPVFGFMRTNQTLTKVVEVK
jgi:hypothetical protein